MGACGRCEADQPVPVLAQAPNRRLLPELPDATAQRGVRINSADVAEVVPVQDHQPGVLGVVRDLGVLPGPTDLQHAVLELLGQDLRRPCASFRDADLRFGFLDQLDKTGLGGEPVAADICVQVLATTLPSRQAPSAASWRHRPGRARLRTTRRPGHRARPGSGSTGKRSSPGDGRAAAHVLIDTLGVRLLAARLGGDIGADHRFVLWPFRAARQFLGDDAVAEVQVVQVGELNAPGALVP